MKTLANLSPVLGIFFLMILSFSDVFGSDTLYFRLSNPWNTVKDPNGSYIREMRT